jgi:hypothetical protein
MGESFGGGSAHAVTIFLSGRGRPLTSEWVAGKGAFGLNRVKLRWLRGRCGQLPVEGRFPFAGESSCQGYGLAGPRLDREIKSSA